MGSIIGLVFHLAILGAVLWVSFTLGRLAALSRSQPGKRIWAALTLLVWIGLLAALLTLEDPPDPLVWFFLAIALVCVAATFAVVSRRSARSLSPNQRQDLT